jgi:hypothetical protein
LQKDVGSMTRRLETEPAANLDSVTASPAVALQRVRARTRLASYPACRWFADLKRRRSDWWLAYV